MTKSQSYPETVPAEFTAEDTQSAYRRGWNHGHGIARHNMPSLGDKVYSDSLGRVTVDAENIREVHADNCYQAADNSRSYSPFEFTAKEFNDCGEGGFRICYDHDDMSDEIYDTLEDAQAAAKAEGWEGTEIREFSSSEELWEAFERGTSDAIQADLETYDDSDYGIEDDEDRIWEPLT